MRTFMKTNENEYLQKAKDFRLLGFKENKNNNNNNNNNNTTNHHREEIKQHSIAPKEKCKSVALHRKHMKKYYLTKPKINHRLKEKSQSVHSDDVYFS